MKLSNINTPIHIGINITIIVNIFGFKTVSYQEQIFNIFLIDTDLYIYP